MRRFLRDNGLSVTLFMLFLVSLVGQALTGWRAHAEELRIHDLPAVGFAAYLTSGHFISAVFENWESEFLQMAAYVLLDRLPVPEGRLRVQETDEHNPEDESPSAHRSDPDAPWPVHRGGLLLKLYSHSLSIALVTLFLVSFLLHLAGSTRRMNEEARRASAAAADHGRHARRSGVLVRELPELAERVPVDRGAAGARHLPAAARDRRSRSPWPPLMRQPDTDKPGCNPSWDAGAASGGQAGNGQTDVERTSGGARRLRQRAVQLPHDHADVARSEARNCRVAGNRSGSRPLPCCDAANSFAVARLSS